MIKENCCERQRSKFLINIFKVRESIMALKLGGLSISSFAGENTLDGKHLKNGQANFPVPTKVSVQTRAGEDPLELHRRRLREAASRAGLDGTDAQEKFVEKYRQFEISFTNPKDDPSPANGLAVKTGEIILILWSRSKSSRSNHCKKNMWRHAVNSIRANHINPPPTVPPPGLPRDNPKMSKPLNATN